MCCALSTLLHAVCGRRITFVHPISAHPSCLTPVCGPGASRVCSTLLWYTAGVPLEPGAHDGPAPSFVCPCRRCVWYTGHVADPCSHVPLSGDARPAVHAGPPQTTRRNHARCDGAVPPARHAGARLPMPRAGSSSEEQVRLEGGQAEIPAADGQGQRRTDHLGVRKWRQVPGRPGDRLYQSRVFPTGSVPGATDGSMPVGFARSIVEFTIISRFHYFYAIVAHLTIVKANCGDGKEHDPFLLAFSHPSSLSL